MRRFSCLLLAAVMALSLTACANGNDPAGSASLPPEDSTTTSSGSETSVQPEETTGPSETQGSATEPAVEPDEPTVSPEPEEVPPETAPNTVPPSTQEPVQPAEPTAPTAPPTTPEPEQPAPAEDAPKILIAYFTWADNTVVEDRDAAIQSALDHYQSMGDRGNYDDVDAVSSASVVAPGNAAQMANWIQQEVGGDLHVIKVADPYPSIYDDCLDRAADEKAEDARPALTSSVSNFDDYDVVFLGFPNWWYTLPMPVLSFVDGYDWSGKTVVPFVTHGTGGLSATVRDLTAALPDDVTVLDAIGVYRADIPHAQADVQSWAAGLDLEV